MTSPNQRRLIVARRSAVLSLFVVAAALTALAAEAQSALGVIDFPTSGSAEAQPHFIAGVLFLHNFEYEDAATHFRLAQEADPGFALAYWGEALTYNHAVWFEQDREAAMRALERLGDTAEERIAAAPTDREKAYMRAVETMYGNTPRAAGKSKDDRDDLYRDEMRRVAEAYPSDDEAQAFYALSILGSAHEGRDFATYMRAAAVVEPVFEKNKDHPGAAHYLIHSYDDPVHAPLGLPMARSYSRIAPDAGHAQHMTSHIFVAMGMWDDVVSANVRARDVQNGRQASLERRPIVCGHYTYWLLYGYTQQGRAGDARNVLDTCYQRVQSEPNQGELWHFARMRARYVLDGGDWEAADRYAAPADAPFDFSYAITTALAAGMRGDVKSAEAIHSAMGDHLKSTPDSDPIPSILHMGLGGNLAYLNGDQDRAIRELRQAAEAEAGLPYEFGPPVVVKPMYELLGEVLAASGHATEAVDAFREQLDRTPLRTASLMGLARASLAAGDAIGAAETAERLAAVWHSADAGVKKALVDVTSH